MYLSLSTRVMTLDETNYLQRIIRNLFLKCPSKKVLHYSQWKKNFLWKHSWRVKFIKSTNLLFLLHLLLLLNYTSHIYFVNVLTWLIWKFKSSVMLCLLVEGYWFLKVLRYLKTASGKHANVQQDLTSSNTSMITSNHARINAVQFRAMSYTQQQVEYCLNKSMTISLSKTLFIIVDYLETIFFSHVQILPNVFPYSTKK